MCIGNVEPGKSEMRRGTWKLRRMFLVCISLEAPCVCVYEIHCGINGLYIWLIVRLHFRFWLCCCWSVTVILNDGWNIIPADGLNDMRPMCIWVESLYIYSHTNTHTHKNAIAIYKEFWQILQNYL